MTSNLQKVFPFLRWFPMSMGGLRADLVAGVTVALVLIPQSMAYAQLAGMPAYYGLYAAFLPVLVGALWGSSSQLATGPVAIVALLTASALAPLAATGSESFIALAILLALLVGLIQLGMGVLRLGAIVNLLSHPVIIGFTNAAAIIIALSQLNKLLGVSMSRSDNFMRDIAGVLGQIGDTHLPTLAMGLAALALMVALKRFAPRLPNVLIAVALATLLSWQLGFERTAQVSHDALRDASARSLVQDHVAAERRRVELSAQLDVARTQAAAADGSTSRVHKATLQHRIELMRLQHDDIVRENRVRMQTLREPLFTLAGAAPGSPELRAAPGGADDGVHWRIVKVDAQQLHLNGGGEVVGTIPPGLPKFALPKLDVAAFSSLLSTAMVIALVAFMEAISIAKAMAAKTRSRIDANQELIGQGLANLAASVSQAFPVSGSFSRSAVNLGAGARTGVASVFSGVLVLVTLLFLTPLLYHLPQAVLAAVIMLAVAGLINVRALVHAWQTHRHDGVAAGATFVATLLFAPHLDMGILIGAALAIALFLHRRMRPRAVILGQHPDGGLADIVTHQLAPLSTRFVAIRFDGALVFVNVAHFEDTVLEALVRFPQARAILVMGSGINEVDASGVDKLRELAERLDKVAVTLYLSGVKTQVLEVFERAHLHEVIPAERLFRSEQQGLQAMHSRYGEVAGGPGPAGATDPVARS